MTLHWQFHLPLIHFEWKIENGICGGCSCHLLLFLARDAISRRCLLIMRRVGGICSVAAPPHSMAFFLSLFPQQTPLSRHIHFSILLVLSIHAYPSLLPATFPKQTLWLVLYYYNNNYFFFKHSFSCPVLSCLFIDHKTGSGIAQRFCLNFCHQLERSDDSQVFIHAWVFVNTYACMHPWKLILPVV